MVLTLTQAVHLMFYATISHDSKLPYEVTFTINFVGIYHDNYQILRRSHSKLFAAIYGGHGVAAY